MRTIRLLTGIFLLSLAACSSGYHLASGYDDVYYSPALVRPGAEPVMAEAVATPGQTNSAITANNITESEYYGSEKHEQPVQQNNYYFGSVYDFEYSSRIRRFYNPIYLADYYDPFYTNMFWYTYDPFFSGISIYMGYGAVPLYYPSFSWRYGYRWWSTAYFHPWFGSVYGYYSWHYDPWRYHFNPWYSHSFYSGYWSGYHAGYWNNPYNYQYIYNSRDRSNYIYAVRGSTGSTTRTREERVATSFGERYESRVSGLMGSNRENIVRDGRNENERDERSGRASGRLEDPRASGGMAAATDISGSRSQENRATRLEEPQRTSAATTRPPAYQAPARELNERAGTQRYARPEQTQTSSPEQRTTQPNYTPPRTYTSPSYQQPRSNEQYRNPQATRPSGTVREVSMPANTGSRTQESQPQRQVTQPANSGQSRQVQTAPTRQVTTPSRGTSSPASTPSRSVSSPSRSSGTSSPPASSGSSSPPPSRSSEGSSSSGRSGRGS